jgi:glucosamine--fructose-6-phosphate aminotransferase (isomerizing)
MPVVVIVSKQGHYDKIVSNIQEIKSRSGRIIATVNQRRHRSKKISRLRY